MLKHLPDQQRFEWTANGHTAIIDYTERDGKYYLTHSEVSPALRGQGIGKKMVEACFEYLLNQNMQAKSICSFIRSTAMRNPKYMVFL